MKTLRVVIKKEFKEDFVTRQAGEQLRIMIIKAFNDKQKIEVDFSDAQVASLSFMDEAFAKLLLEGWKKEDISQRISFVNLDPMDKAVLDKMILLRM